MDKNWHQIYKLLENNNLTQLKDLLIGLNPADLAEIISFTPQGES